MLRVVVVAAQAATFAITWRLWQARVAPPLLPLVGMPALSFGVALLGTLGLVLVRPVLGTVCHGFVLGVAMFADQTREQPQVLSLALLLVATLPWHHAARFGCLQLAATWGWAGIGKLTSPRAWDEVGTFLLGAEADGTPAGIAARVVGLSVGGAELALAGLALMRRTRRSAGLLGCPLHLGILGVLSPMGRDWNASVWPWNGALAVASLLLLRRSSADSPATALPRSWCFPLLASVLFVGMPIGFHLGFVDAPMAQQVYTGNTCRALVLRRDGSSETVSMLPELRVVLPPVPRIFRVWFRHHGGPGDRMILIDDRPLATLWGPREQRCRFEEGR